MHANNAYDAIVIGTGAGGACAAYELAHAGLRTLALEKGPWLQGRDFLEGGVFGHAFSSRGRGDELKYTTSHYIMPKREPRFLCYSEHGQAEPAPSPTTAGWMSQLVGGGTVHYGGASFRFTAVDFEMRNTFGDPRISGLGEEHQASLNDWPIRLDELVPFYERAERLIGVAGAPASGLPELRFNKAAARIRDALLRVGSAVRVVPTPMAINSADHMGREPCHNSGLCQEYACRFEAKSDVRVTLLRAAEQTGNLSIKPLTFVRRLVVSGGRTASLECVTRSPAGEPTAVETINAPVVLVACETIETNRLLLASGIGNADVLGRYLMFHVTGGARSLAPEPTTTWDTAPHTAYIPSFYESSSAGPMPFLKAGILLPTSIGGPLQEGGRFWGERALTFFNEVYPFKMDLSYIGEGLPTRYNRVELSTVDDQCGMAGATISYRPHPFDLNAGRAIAAKCKEILTLAGGAIEDSAAAHLRPFLGKETTARRLFHCTGGCRFGDDPKTSVLDRTCKVHELDNVYVVDGSVFPTGGGANPTLTIQANAMRVGQIVAARFGKRGA